MGHTEKRDYSLKISSDIVCTRYCVACFLLCHFLCRPFVPILTAIVPVKCHNQLLLIKLQDKNKQQILRISIFTQNIQQQLVFN